MAGVSYPNLTWHPNPQSTISENGKLLTQTADERMKAIAIPDDEVEKYYYEFELVEPGKEARFGIMAQVEEFDVLVVWNGAILVRDFNSDFDSEYTMGCLEYPGVKLNKGDKLGAVVDMAAQTLEFFYNGKGLGSFAIGDKSLSPEYSDLIDQIAAEKGWLPYYEADAGCIVRLTMKTKQ